MNQCSGGMMTKIVQRKQGLDNKIFKRSTALFSHLQPCYILQLCSNGCNTVPISVPMDTVKLGITIFYYPASAHGELIKGGSFFISL
jgi:hypothetical protein